MKHLYLGYGKGKTTASIGMCVRMLGAGKKVMWVSTLKDGESSEVKWLIENTSFRLHKVEGFVYQMSAEEKKKNQEELIYFLDKLKIQFSDYDMIVLDEFIDLIDVGLLTVDYVREYLSEIDMDLEVIVSGHSEYPSLEDLFDYYTEFNCQKHPFENGVKARKGIEY